MLKRLLITLLLAITGITAGAQGIRVSYGAEWGMSPVLFNSHNFNYIASEGYRVEDDGAGPCFMPEGFLLVNIGMGIGKHVEAGLTSGLMGISAGNRICPLMLQTSLFRNDRKSDGHFAYLAAGAGFHSRMENMPSLAPCALGKVGIGYRLALDRNISLDFKGGLSAALDHAHIMDSDTGTYISGHDIRRNSARYYALNMSIALSF